ncbi:MAG: dihydroorotate dehydrogenase electron transfer subunit [Gammaproteobacteria bacterium]
MNGRGTRGTLFLEEAEVIAHEPHAAQQFVLRLSAPKTALRARPGHFVHIQCHPAIPMRRPMSVMLADRALGRIDILYKVHGLGTELLAKRAPGETLSLLGPIGVPFKLSGYRRRPLLIGGGVGIPPMLFLAQHLRTQTDCRPFAILGSELPFPFKPRPSRFMVPGLPAEVIAAMPLLEDWEIASRLTSLRGFPGCFEGYVTDLARRWLRPLDAGGRADIELFACGPTAMLKSVARLSEEYELPCQLSLEEYMACAVGACAGCTVGIRTPAGPAMKRVCVDGPVFEAQDVLFA